MAKRASDYEKKGGGYKQREKRHKEETCGAQQQSGLAKHLVPQPPKVLNP